MKRLYIGGTFDLLHPGHIALFKACSEEGEVVVALNTDEFCQRYKRKPIMNFEQRKIMVEACRYVDKVITNTGDEDSKPSIIASGATHVVHGDDWTGPALMKQMGLTKEFLQLYDIEMMYLPYTQGVSTSDIIKAIHESYRNMPSSSE